LSIPTTIVAPHAVEGHEVFRRTAAARQVHGPSGTWMSTAGGQVWSSASAARGGFAPGRGTEGALQPTPGPTQRATLASTLLDRVLTMPEAEFRLPRPVLWPGPLFGPVSKNPGQTGAGGLHNQNQAQSNTFEERLRAGMCVRKHSLPALYNGAGTMGIDADPKRWSANAVAPVIDQVLQAIAAHIPRGPFTHGQPGRLGRGRHVRNALPALSGARGEYRRAGRRSTDHRQSSKGMTPIRRRLHRLASLLCGGSILLRGCTAICARMSAADWRTKHWSCSICVLRS